MFKRMKNIRAGTLIAHLVVTLAYPAYKAFTTTANRLLVFTDVTTIVALVLLIVGIFYSLVLHGNFDAVSYSFLRGLERSQQSYEVYSANNKERRAEAFNYPLFLGLVYLAACIFIAYVIY